MQIRHWALKMKLIPFLKKFIYHPGSVTFFVLPSEILIGALQIKTKIYCFAFKAKFV